MSVCPSCGSEIAAGEKFCSNCGQPVPAESQDHQGKAMTSGCPACGGALLFDPTSGKLKCEFRASEYTPEEVEEAWAAKAKEAAGAGGKAEIGPEDEMKSYSCKTCGAEPLAEQTTAGMKCPYCGNQTIFPAQFSGNSKPDYIIPFAHTKKEAEEKYLSYYQKRFLLPKSFKSDNHVEEIQGVYVPFWLFSGDLSMEGNYKAADYKRDDKGNRICTGRYEVERKGNISFEKVPADASKRMDDALMDSVEPYQMDGMKNFSLTYLPGFMAERFDVDMKDDKERTNKRVENTLSAAVQKTIKHDEIESKTETFSYSNEKVNYALMPVWLLITKWQDKEYKFAMNGQTGKMIGDLPISVPKFLMVILPIFAAILAIGIAALGTDYIGQTLLVDAIVTGIIALIMYGSMKPVSKANEATDYITKPLELTHSTEKKVWFK